MGQVSVDRKIEYGQSVENRGLGHRTADFRPRTPDVSALTNDVQAPLVQPKSEVRSLNSDVCYSCSLLRIHNNAWLLVLLSAGLQIVIFPLPDLYFLDWA